MEVCMVPIEREEEDVLVLLSFVWFPSDNMLFIASDSGMTSLQMVVLSVYQFIHTNMHHYIKQSTASPDCTYILGIIVS